MADRVAVAKFIEAALATGRSTMTTLQLLSEDELKVVVDDFLNRSGTQWRVTVDKSEHCWALENNKIDAIKSVRHVTGATLKDAKDFVCGDRSILVNDTQKTELVRMFGSAIKVE